MKLSSSLYVGQVYHRRHRPKEHVLKYSVFSMLLDLSEIDALAERVWLFSVNRFNLLSFNDADFGDSALEETLHEYVCRILISAGIETQPSRIMLSCFPRILGYSFNPLSLFYCFDNEGVCFAVVYEVHNTFGERHAYVLPVEHMTESSDWIQQQCDKELFVSPFAHMDMHYHFRLNEPANRQVIVIRASDAEGIVITASYTADQRPFSSTQLFRLFLVFPFQSFKVVAGIHWEALRLFIKGVPWFKHQPKRSN